MDRNTLKPMYLGGVLLLFNDNFTTEKLLQFDCFYFVLDNVDSLSL